MPRRDLGTRQREFLNNTIIWEVVQAQYNNGLNGVHLPLCDASLRYLGVPPMRNMTTGAWNSIGPAIDTANPYRRPDMLEIYRPGSSEYFIRMDTAPDSRYAGAMQPDVIHRMNINPGVETIGWCAVEGTSPLRINWLFGA